VVTDDDARPLRPAAAEGVAEGLSYALRFDGRGRAGRAGDAPACAAVPATGAHHHRRP
jgi:hypothetical protein